MAKLLNTLLARLVLAALAIHAVLVPMLFFSVMHIFTTNEIDLFVNDARAYARFLADLAEVEAPRMSDDELEGLLDSMVLSKDTVYAEFSGPERTVRSSLVSPSEGPFPEDFVFGAHGDATYFISVPLNGPRSRGMVLRLGFDERPTEATIASARNELLLTLVSFVGLSIVFVVVLGILLLRPLKHLQLGSQRVASGRYEETLEVKSRIVEVEDLATDLERMRRALVGVNQQLRSEMRERQDAEEARAKLERRLRHVQRLETVGTLAGGIAHEFNNLLVPIKLYTELAADDLPEESQMRADLERVLVAVERAKGLVQQILTFGRQSQPERKQLIEFGSVVDEVLKFARDVFPATIEIVAHIDPDAGLVDADVGQMHQLIMNLCSNAYQAIAPNPGTISIDVESVKQGERTANLAPGAYVKLAVSDTGHGIDPTIVERIFEPFFTTRPPGEGTGLGLSVAHGIAVNHHGAITVRSEPGRGSTFSVFLPRAYPERAEQRTERSDYRIVCIACEEAINEDREALLAECSQVVTVGSRGELLAVLGAHEDADAIVLDVGRGKLWQKLEQGDIGANLVESGRLLVIAPLDAMLGSEEIGLTGSRHLVTPLDPQQLRATLDEMLESRTAVASGGT